MSTVTERIGNLIRVVRAVPNNKFDLAMWYNTGTHCGCALGHAMRDNWFVAQGFSQPYVSLSCMKDVADFFEISIDRVNALFVRHIGYETRQDVLTALRVLLLEKMAKELTPQVEAMEIELAE